MAIEKKLIHFKTNAEFKKRLNNNEILDTSIVFIKETSEIYTHGELYSYINWGYIDEDVSPEYTPLLDSSGTNLICSDGQELYVIQ